VLSTTSVKSSAQAGHARVVVDGALRHERRIRIAGRVVEGLRHQRRRALFAKNFDGETGIGPGQLRGYVTSAIDFPTQ
jgi:TolB-like protein